MSVLLALLLSSLAIFLVLLVLVQRGRGGGLAGALGGMGGSSAFGAKAGDVFTRITIVVVAIWIVACILAGHWAKHRGDKFSGSQPTSSSGTGTTQQSTPPPTTTPSGPQLPLPTNKSSDTPAEKKS